MIKTLLYILVLALYSPCMQSTQLAMPEGQNTTEIIIKKGAHHGNNPRQDTTVPISAYVVSNSIYLTFISNLGAIHIILEEETDGIVLSTVVNSSDLLVVIPFSGTSGVYTITLIDSLGIDYSGTFTIN